MINNLWHFRQKSDGRAITKQSQLIEQDDDSNIIDSELIDEEGLSDQPESASRSDQEDFQSDSNNTNIKHEMDRNAINTNIVNLLSEHNTQQYTSWVRSRNLWITIKYEHN